LRKINCFKLGNNVYVYLVKTLGSAEEQFVSPDATAAINDLPP
jgi:hypothetical protein